MARYTKVLKSLAHNAVGNKRIESAAPAGNNFYVTGATLNNSDDVLTLAVKGAANVTVDLSHLAQPGSPGGSDTQVQYNNGGAFAGNSGFTYNGTNVTMTSNLLLGSNLVHNGDTDTYLGFETDNIRFYAGNTNTMNIKAAGVGIGTNAPSEKFNVESASNTLALFKSTDNRGLIQVADDDTTASIVAEDSTLSLGLTSQIATTNINIDTDGKLGIGITDPVRHLDVNSGTIDNVVRFTSSDNRANIQLSDDDTNRYIVTENSAISLGPNSSLHSNNLNIVGSPAKVGIGTTSPAQSLDVRGTTLLSGATDTVPFEVFAYGAGTSALHVTSGSNTGLGTATPLGKLHINASAYQMVFQRDTHHHTIVKGNSDDTLTFATGAPGSHTARFKIQPTGIDVVNNAIITGSVGIGTSSPGETLHVAGTSRVTGKAAFGGSTLPTNNGISVVDTVQIQEKGSAPTATTAYGTFWVSGSTPNKPYFTDDAGNHHNLLDDGPIAGSITDNQIAFGATTANSIEGSANLTYDGTNLSLAPDTDVTATIGRAVVGYTFSDYASFTHYQVRGDTGAYALLQNDTGGTYLNAAASKPIYFRINNSDKMRLTSSGDLGIGTTSPSTKLHVSTADEMSATFESTDDTSRIRVMDDDTTTYVVAKDNFMSLGTNNTLHENNLNVKNDGKVGIGITSPTSKLHVKGTLDIQDGNQTILMGAGNSSTSRSNDTLKLARVGLAHYHNAEEPVAMLYAASNGTDNTVVMGGGTSGMNAATRLQFATAENDATTAGTVRASIQGDSNYDKLYLGADTTLGFWRYSNRLDFYISSNPRIHLDASKLYSATSGGPLLDLTPTSGEANYGFVDDANTGMSRTGADTLVLMTAGTTALTIDSSQNTSIAGNLMFPDSNNTISAFGSDNLYLRAHNDMYFNIDTPNDSTSRHFIFRANTSTEIMRLGEDKIAEFKGDVCIGASATANGAPLHVLEDGTNNLVANFLSADAIAEIRIGDNSKYTRLLTVGSQYKIMPNDGVELMVLDGNTEKVGIGTNSPNEKLTVEGVLSLDETSAPSATSGYGKIYVKSSDSKLYFMNDSGTETDLTAGGGGGTIGGSLSDNNIPIGTAANTVGDFSPAYSEGTNIIIGRTGQSTTTDADDNTIYGYNAGYALTDGDRNVLIGRNAAENLTTGISNVAVGRYAMQGVSTTSYNVAVGTQAGSNVSEGGTNVGHTAGSNGGSRTTSFGYQAALYPDGNYNTAIGYQALRGNSTSSTGYNNVAVGYQAGHDLTSGYRNTLVGYQAGYDLESGLDNTIIGQQAGVNITSGPRNTIVGSYAGDALTTVDGVVALGYAALGAGAGASYDIAIGYQAHNNGTGRGVFIGLQAGAATTGGGTIIGSEAGETNTVGNLTLIGYEAGKMVSGTATSMTAVGHGVSTNASGTYHTMVGFQAGNKLKGNVNTGVGYKVLQSGANATHQNNIAIGYQTMQGGDYSVTNQDNVAIGVNAMRYASGSSYNVVVGQALFAQDQTSTQVVAIGYRALSGATSTAATTAIGHLAARDLTTGDSHTVIGKSAMLKVTTSSYNTVVGVDALSEVDGAGSTTAVGFGAMKYSSADNATGIGQYALSGATGDYNAALGNSAGAIAKGSAGAVMVGYQAGLRPTGNYNVWMGYRAGYGVVDQGAQNNVGIGKEAMLNVTTGQENVAVGDQSGYSITTGGYNVAIGSDAFRAATTANYNVAIGKNAMNAGTLTANHNVAIGYNAASSAQGAATENVAVGSYAGQDLTTGPYNVFVGTYAGTGNTTGQENVAIGHSALQENQEGDHIVAIGRYAAYNTNPTAGTGDSVVVGTQAGFTNTTGVQNTFIGHRAGYSNTTSNQQVFVGREAGYNHTEGTTNIFIGARSGYLNTTGANNTVVGHQALYNNVHGDRNTAIGYQALHSSTPSDGGGTNTAVGDRAGYTTSTGHSNVYMGYLAGYSLTDGERNVIIGHEAGRLTSTLDFSVLIGNGAGYNSSGASSAVYLGRSAGYFASGNSNTFIGTSAGRGDSSLTHATVSSVAIGLNAMYYHSTANYSVAVGESALIGNSSSGLTGDYNVAVGRQALADTSTGYGNVAMGYLAGKSISSGRDSVFIGLQAGQYTSTGVENTMIGYLAGRNTVAGSYNTFMGWMSGLDNVGSRNTFLGYASGHEYKQSGDGTNTAVGMYAMHRIETGSANVAMGYEALKGVVGSDNDRNVAIGGGALYSTDGGDENVAIGYNSGYSTTTGTGNVFIGCKAGSGTTATDSNKLFINNTNGTPLIGGDFSSGGTLTFTASGNAPYSTVFKHSQVSTNGEDGIAIDAREPRLSFINRRDTDETWKIMANNGNSSLQIAKDSQLVKAIFSPDDGGGVTFGIAAVAATSGVAIAQGASYSLDNTTVNRIYRTSSDVSYMSNELHYFNNPVKVNGNLATASLGQALEFADRDDLLIRGTASYDMEITAPQDVAFGIDSDNNETTHAFLWKKDTKTPSSAGTELMRLNELGRLGIGTNAPVSQLHVSGAATQELRVNSSDSGAYSRIQLRSATDGYAQLNMGDSGADAAGGLVYTHSTDTLNIRAANSNIVNVTSTGVGIGITPSELLHLKGGKLEIENSDSSKHLQIDENSIRTTTNNDLSIFSNGNSNQFVLNQSNGRIGMGTSSPDDKLHVYHSTLNTMALFESGDSKSLIKIKDNASTQYVISESSKLSIGGQNELHASNLNVDSAGNVGIGTTSPSQKLDVVGAAQIGSLIVTGSTLAVQRTMKNDVLADTTLSDSYSVYQALADGGGAGTVTLTAPPSPSVGDTYLIVAGAFGNPGGGGAPTLTGLVRIIANSGQSINGVSTNISIMQSTALQPEYKTAHLVCVDTNTWVMTISAQAPVA